VDIAISETNKASNTIEYPDGYEWPEIRVVFSFKDLGVAIKWVSITPIALTFERCAY